MAHMIRKLRSSPLGVGAAALFALALMCLMLFAYRGWSANGREPGAAQDPHEHAEEAANEGVVELDEEAQRLADLRTDTVRRRRLGEYIEAPGVLHANPDGTATVSSSVAGVIESVSANVGDQVRQGDALLTLRCPELATAQAEVATAAADLAAAQDALKRRKALADEGEFGAAPYEQARRAYEEAEETLRLAESNLERVTRLAELGAPSRPAAEEAAEELSEARQAAASADAQLQSARASLATTQRIAGRLEDRSGNGEPTSAQRGTAEARLAEAQAELRTARENRTRLANLLPDGLATKQELAEAVAREAKAAADLEAANLGLRTVDTPVDEARLSVTAAAQQAAQAETALAEARKRLTVAEARASRETAVADEEIPTRQRVAETQKELKAAQAASEQARSAWEREKVLHGADMRSREALAEREAAVTAAGARLEAAQRTVVVLGQGRQRPGGRLALLAPASGTVSTRTAHVGMRVEAGAALLEIVALNTIWVEAAFYQKDLPRLAAGQPMDVELMALPGRASHTTVYAVDPRLDEHTRKGTVRGLLDNPGGKLLPEMFATVRVRVGEVAEALAVPQDAVQQEDDQQYVFVVERSGRYVRREVVTGLRAGGWVEIKEGLAGGETIVVGGAFLLKSELHKGEMEHEH